MSKYVKIAVWNVQGGLNTPPVLAEIDEVRHAGAAPDVWVLTQATRADQELHDIARWVLGVFNPDQAKDDPPQPSVLAARHAAPDDSGSGRHAAQDVDTANGQYALHFFPYDDDDQRSVGYTMAVVARTEMVRQAEYVRLAGRTALKLTLEDGTEEGTDLLAADFDHYSGEKRLWQTEDAVRLLGSRAIVAGGTRAMHKQGFWPRVLHGLAPVFDKLAATSFLRPKGPKRHVLRRRLGGMVVQLQQAAHMADGKVATALEMAGFGDAARRPAPTRRRFGLGLPMEQVLQRGLGVAQSTETHGTYGSSHDRLDAVISLAKR